jgi:hypothetical protein
MFARDTARVLSPAPAIAAPARRRLPRRDPRRFGRAPVWLDDVSLAVESEPASDLRLFAHSFAGFFLFFSLLIA